MFFVITRLPTKGNADEYINQFNLKYLHDAIALRKYSFF